MTKRKRIFRWVQQLIQQTVELPVLMDDYYSLPTPAALIQMQLVSLHQLHQGYMSSFRPSIAHRLSWLSHHLIIMDHIRLSA